MAKKKGEEGDKKVDLSMFLNEIQVAAHEIFWERQKKGKAGDQMSDWLAAEEKIKKKHNLG